jgi:hypothetical protein
LIPHGECDIDQESKKTPVEKKSRDKYLLLKIKGIPLGREKIYTGILISYKKNRNKKRKKGERGVRSSKKKNMRINDNEEGGRRRRSS